MSDQALQKSLEKWSSQPATAPMLAGLPHFPFNQQHVWDEAEKLIALNLRGVGISDADWEILYTADLSQLQVLILGNNKLNKLMLHRDMPALRYLDVSGNEGLRELQLHGDFSSLERLDAHACRLHTLNLRGNFPSIHFLDLHQNELSQLDLIPAMPVLKTLDISKNNLNRLNLPITLPQLQGLYLKNNPLGELYFLQSSFPSLETLDVRSCSLQNLPRILLNCGALLNLYIADNPLPSVPRDSIPEENRSYQQAENAWDNLKGYLQSLEEDRPVNNDEVKLVLLGNSTAGKSSLMEYLEHKTFELGKNSTHGIQNQLWKADGQDFQVNMWDFGGQEYYHATHRLFLSDNSVSVVVFEEKTNKQKEVYMPIFREGEGEVMEWIEHFPYAYWLEGLKLYCGDEALPGTFLVQNKMDESTEVRIPDQDKDAYALTGDRLFRISLLAAHKKDRKYVRSFEELEDSLVEALNKACHKYDISEKWLEIKTALRNLSRGGTKFISYDAYVAFCEKIRPGISIDDAGKENAMLKSLTNYLRGIGVILYYPEIKTLKDIVFIDAVWVAKMIYRVLDTQVIKAEGAFHKERICDKVKELEADVLISLMHKFELIFPSKKVKDTFVAPQYLGKKEPKSFKKFKNICGHFLFSLRYPQFLRPSVLARFICRYGELSDDEFWKKGILIEYEGVYVLVKVGENQTIQVFANKPVPELAGPIFQTFQELNNHNPNILLSVDGKHEVTMENFMKQPDENAMIEDILGNQILFEPFIPLKGRMMEGQMHTMKLPPPQNMKLAKELIQNLIAASELEEALRLLKQVLGSNEAILLQARLNGLKKDIRKGTLSSEQKDLLKSRLNADILSLSEEVSDSQLISHDGPKKQDEPTLNEIENPPTKAQIYISYAWGDKGEKGKSREKIVTDLYDSLNGDGFDVRIDKKNLKFGESLNNFMTALGKGDLVVVCVSDKYLRSPFCMWELCEVFRTSQGEKEKFAERIIPVRVENLSLGSPLTLMPYLKHWRQKYEEWEEMYTDFPQEMGSTHMEEFRKSRTIKDSFSEVVGFFNDLLGKNSEELLQDNFDELKALIVERSRRLGRD